MSDFSATCTAGATCRREPLVIDVEGAGTAEFRAVSLRFGEEVWRCDTCSIVCAVEQKQRACRRVDCMTWKKKVAVLEGEKRGLERKLAMCAVKGEREWRGIVEKLREENVELTRKLRVAQSARNTAESASRRVGEEMVGVEASFVELQGAAEKEIAECADACMKQASSELERRLQRVEREGDSCIGGARKAPHGGCDGCTAEAQGVVRRASGSAG